MRDVKVLRLRVSRVPEFESIICLCQRLYIILYKIYIYEYILILLYRSVSMSPPRSYK